MTPEAKVKARVTKQLDALGAYWFKPMGTGFASSGVADIVGCYRGKYFSIECKAGKNTTTPLQDRHLDKVRQAGGIALVINEDNVDTLAVALQDNDGW